MKFLTDQQLDRVLDTLVWMTFILSTAYVLTHSYFEATFK